MSIKALLVGAAALALSSAAQAAVNVYIWTGLPDGGAPSNATLAQAGFPGAIGTGPLGAPNGSTTVGGINFSTLNSPGTTVATWLNNPGGLAPAVANASVNDTYMLFTGDIFLNAGANPFNIDHDDGLQLFIDGIGLVVNGPGPTPPITTLFNINAPAAGTYHYTMSYGECCGGPAELIWAYVNGQAVGSVPEPGTWMMMLLGFAGIGLAIRGSKKALPQLA